MGLSSFDKRGKRAKRSKDRLDWFQEDDGWLKSGLKEKANHDADARPDALYAFEKICRSSPKVPMHTTCSSTDSPRLLGKRSFPTVGAANEPLSAHDDDRVSLATCYNTGANSMTYL